MQGNYAGFAQSVVAIVDFFARQALAGSWHAGLVSAWSHREGPAGAPGRRVGLEMMDGWVSARLVGVLHLQVELRVGPLVPAQRCKPFWRPHKERWIAIAHVDYDAKRETESSSGG